MTKIEFTNENGTYAASVPEEELTIQEVIDNCIVPALLAAGYGDATIAKLIDSNIL